MRLFSTFLIGQAAQAALLVPDFASSGNQMSSAFEDVTLSTPVELFGTREFTNVYVNEAGAVSFDKEFYNITQGTCSLNY